MNEDEMTALLNALATDHNAPQPAGKVTAEWYSRTNHNPATLLHIIAHLLGKVQK